MALYHLYTSILLYFSIARGHIHEGRRPAGWSRLRAQRSEGVVGLQVQSA